MAGTDGLMNVIAKAAVGADEGPEWGGIRDRYAILPQAREECRGITARTHSGLRRRTRADSICGVHETSRKQEVI